MAGAGSPAAGVTLPRSTGRGQDGLGLSIGMLAAARVVNNRWPTTGYVARCATATAALVGHARRRGLTWSELGMDRSTWRPGIAWAAGAVAAVGGCYYLVAVATPAARRAFVDDRADASARGAARQALVPVLFGTVLLEEAGFRGVLWGQLNRRFGAAVATASSSVLFGVWHVRPSATQAQHDQAIARAVGFGSRSTAVLAVSSVCLTAAAGVVFGELRRRSGSLLAPAGLHWAANGLGLLTASLVQGRLPVPPGDRSGPGGLGLSGPNRPARPARHAGGWPRRRRRP
jgi:membrane protease YdiL (CAAX protease family)